MASARDARIAPRLITLFASVLVAVCLMLALQGLSTGLDAGTAGGWASAAAPAPAQSGQPAPAAVEAPLHAGQRGETDPDTGRSGKAVAVASGLPVMLDTARRPAPPSPFTGLAFPPRPLRSPPSQAPPQAA